MFAGLCHPRPLRGLGAKFRLSYMSEKLRKKKKKQSQAEKTPHSFASTS